jgi:hypothetical protein
MGETACAGERGADQVYKIYATTVYSDPSEVPNNKGPVNLRVTHTTCVDESVITQTRCIHNFNWHKLENDINIQTANCPSARVGTQKCRPTAQVLMEFFHRHAPRDQSDVKQHFAHRCEWGPKDAGQHWDPRSEQGHHEVTDLGTA